MDKRTRIQKEKLRAYRIVPAFVDKNKQWPKVLESAVRPGNEPKGKTIITFETLNAPAQWIPGYGA